MRIVSWNVNSIRRRLDAVLDFSEDHDIDVVCLQETKIEDQGFPEDEFGDAEYDVEYFGQRSYNGVAIATREVATDVLKNLPSDEPDAQRRLLACTTEGVRVINVYCPNGQSLDADAFRFKLDWYRRLREHLETLDPRQPLVLCGDFNICLEDRDAFYTDGLGERLFTTTAERDAVRALLDWGLVDAYRTVKPDGDDFTWWDYRNAGFVRNEGLRIDLFLVTAPVAERLEDVVVHRAERGKDNPSDHAPIELILRD